MKWLALLALAACDWSLHRMQEQPKCTTHGMLAGSACDLTPPAGIVALGDDAVPARPPLSRALIDRGRNRYERFCAPCHGLAGDSDSDVSRAMTVRRPPSLVDETARRLADDRVYFVISRGYGVMPSYGGALAPADRWAVISYVRALEAREIAVGDVPDGMRANALEEASRWPR